MQDNFTLDAQDMQLIAAAKAQGGAVWENESLASVKRKIKTHYLAKTDEQCCYCRKNFTGEFSYVIDIEHVLPKAHYPDLVFELLNLSVSCKRCNMNIKRESTTFLIDPVGIVNQVGDSAQYLLSHPNLDEYFQQMTFLTQTVNNKKSVKYIPLTEKGNFTYKFFKLHLLEIETLNLAQGIAATDGELSENIPANLAAEIQDLLKDL